MDTAPVGLSHWLGTDTHLSASVFITFCHCCKCLRQSIYIQKRLLLLMGLEVSLMRADYFWACSEAVPHDGGAVMEQRYPPPDSQEVREQKAHLLSDL